MSTPQSNIAFLFDVDNTLLDNDRVIADRQAHLEREVGAGRAEHHWRLFEQLRSELGYADYLGALQRYRGEYPHAGHHHCLPLSVELSVCRPPFPPRAGGDPTRPAVGAGGPAHRRRRGLPASARDWLLKDLGAQKEC